MQSKAHLRHHAAVPPRTAADDLSAYRLSPAQLHQTLEYIRANLAGEISLRRLAGVVGYSPSYFVRVFKATTGVTPHQFILRERVTKARELLQEGRLTISQVAMQAGFSSQSHLTAHLRRTLGVTPKDIQACGAAVEPGK